MTAQSVIIWFRDDLRLHDHEGVEAALRKNLPVIACYIYDEEDGKRNFGDASKWWLHRSLKVLDENLTKFGSRLIIRKGDSYSHLKSIAKEYNAKSIIYTVSNELISKQKDKHTASLLYRDGIRFEPYNTRYIFDPESIKNNNGLPYRVFTPFARACLNQYDFKSKTLRNELPKLFPTPLNWPQSLSVDALELAPKITPNGQDWSAGFNIFRPGEDGAVDILDQFINSRWINYDDTRDRPDLEQTSHLSAHLRFGEISPRRIWSALDNATKDAPALTAAAQKFKLELLWREFSNMLLQQNPNLHDSNFNKAFDYFPWQYDSVLFKAWRCGETGYDIVDAGMKQLWQTGYMHNRVRMIAASFLTKHLMIDWRYGEKWFWDCLLDADPANNPANWQWVAGCGADAAPYFRIFNPISNAVRFDPNGHYRERYLGKNYEDTLFSKRPAMIVDHSLARQRALQAYQYMRQKHEDAG